MLQPEPHSNGRDELLFRETQEEILTQRPARNASRRDAGGSLREIFLRLLLRVHSRFLFAACHAVACEGGSIRGCYSRSASVICNLSSVIREARVSLRWRLTYSKGCCRKIWRCSYQAERYLTIQSIKARSKPMSTPAFSLSIHLCRKISALSAKNSLYKDEFLTRSVASFMGASI